MVSFAFARQCPHGAEEGIEDQDAPVRGEALRVLRRAAARGSRAVEHVCQTGSGVVPVPWGARGTVGEEEENASVKSGVGVVHIAPPDRGGENGDGTENETESETGNETGNETGEDAAGTQ